MQVLHKLAELLIKFDLYFLIGFGKHRLHIWIDVFEVGQMTLNFTDFLVVLSAHVIGDQLAYFFCMVCDGIDYGVVFLINERSAQELIDPLPLLKLV